MPAARVARTITSLMTGPRRLPTWTVPDGVFESLRTWGPERRAASSSAQNMGAGRLADADDGVGDRTGRGLDRDLVALLVSHQGGADRRLVADAPVARSSLCRAHDGEGLFPVGSLDHDLGADADLVAVDLFDDFRVLQLRLERGDAALQERLLLLGVLVLRVLGDVAIQLRVVDARRHPRALGCDQVIQLGLELGEPFGSQIDGLVVHSHHPFMGSLRSSMR